MNDYDNDTTMEAPKKPLSPMANAIGQGIAGLTAGVLASVIVQKLFYSKKPLDVNEIGAVAGTAGGISVAMGYVSGKKDHDKYQVEVDKVKLHHRVNELEHQLTEEKTPHVERLAQSEPEQQEQACHCPR